MIGVLSGRRLPKSPTPPIARGVGQPRLAPAPFLILRHPVEAHPASRQIGDPGVERAAFEIGGRPPGCSFPDMDRQRSEEHTSELQSLMRISYAVFCLNKKKDHKTQQLQIR